MDGPGSNTICSEIERSARLIIDHPEDFSGDPCESPGELLDYLMGFPHWLSNSSFKRENPVRRQCPYPLIKGLFVHHRKPAVEQVVSDSSLRDDLWQRQ